MPAPTEVQDGDELSLDLPPAVRRVLAVLSESGAEAALVGGCVRDAVRGEQPTDWDVATGAPPQEVERLFARSTWENPFGTVTVLPDDDGPAVEVTTFRIEGPYHDRRRPEAVRWSGSLREDLARRDFTINAMAWVPHDLLRGIGRLVDPFGGSVDMRAGLLRAVGDPDDRIGEDALRMVRAVRFAERFGLELDPSTEEAIRRHADSAATLSGERVRDELMRMLSAVAPPSAGLRRMESLGLLNVLLPELQALRGVPQAKALAGDALDHSLRTADALPGTDPQLRLAGLIHDIGKATTLADGHFIGHEREGAALAARLLRRLRFPRADIERIRRLVRQHMFAYAPEWTDAAVRRFVRRVGPDLLDDLFALRAADNLASGASEPSPGGLDELRRRAAQAVARDPISTGQLAVDGDVLIAELGIAQGPVLGQLLRDLLEAVLDDPALNTRDALLALARRTVSVGTDGASPQREAMDSTEALE